MLKHFLTFSEAASELGTDIEGLRQAYEIGIAKELPAFVHAGSRPFLATLVGCGAIGEFNIEKEANQVTLKNGTVIREAFFHDNKDPHSLCDQDLGDQFGQVDFTLIPSSQTGYPGGFELRGFFRVWSSYYMQEAARECFLGMAGVAPLSWWEGKAPHQLLDDGDELPRVRFELKPTKITKFCDLPELLDVYIRSADIHTFTSKLASSGLEENREKTGKPLDARERNYLLCIIGALARNAKLDLSKPMKAGEAIARMVPEIDLKARTVGEHLKRVPGALESRRK